MIRPESVQKVLNQTNTGGVKCTILFNKGKCVKMKVKKLNPSVRHHTINFDLDWLQMVPWSAQPGVGRERTPLCWRLLFQAFGQLMRRQDGPSLLVPWTLHQTVQGLHIFVHQRWIFYSHLKGIFLVLFSPIHTVVSYKSDNFSLKWELPACCHPPFHPPIFCSLE